MRVVTKGWVKEGSRSFVVDSSHQMMVLCDTFRPNVWQIDQMVAVDIFVHVSVEVCLPDNSIAMVLESWMYLSTNQLCPYKYHQNKRWQTDVATSASIDSGISYSMGRAATLDLKRIWFRAAMVPPRIFTKRVSRRMVIIAGWKNGFA